jgi:RNA polymerase primary sigma factor
MRANDTNPFLRQFCDRPVRLAAGEQKLRQADLAERLLTELDPSQTYTCQYLGSQITCSPETSPALSVNGREARRDLQLFVEDLSDAADVPAEAAGEPVLTLEEVSRRLNVSTKTVSRWREHGLVGRRFVVDGRKRVGFLQSTVDRFVSRNENRVHRAAQFSQLTDRERDGIVANARRLALDGHSTAEITRQVAAQTGRSVETIRYLLKQFERDHPQAGAFSERSNSVGQRMKREIYQRYRRGESTDVLARRFSRSRTSVYRAISEMRLQHVNELPLDYIHNEEFDRGRSDQEEQQYLGPAPSPETAGRKLRRPANLPTYLASMYEVPLLTRQQEAHLFRKMNYLKYKAAKLRDGLHPDHPSSSAMDRVESLYEQSVAVKNEIIRANLRLVVSIAKRRVGPTGEFFDLVSDGNMSLIRAVEKFDYARGNKFSTYATWAIMKNFARTIPNEHRHQERFRTSADEVFLAAADTRSDPYEQQSAQSQRQSQVAKILGRLDQREQQVIAHRFGLGADQKPRTLREVGALLGVTKERVRQLESRAIGKLRAAAREEKIDIPGVA